MNKVTAVFAVLSLFSALFLTNFLSSPMAYASKETSNWVHYKYHCMQADEIIMVTASVDLISGKVGGASAVILKDGHDFASNITDDSVNITPEGFAVKFYFHPTNPGTSIIDYEQEFVDNPEQFKSATFDTRESEVTFASNGSLNSEFNFEVESDNSSCKIMAR